MALSKPKNYSNMGYLRMMQMPYEWDIFENANVPYIYLFLFFHEHNPIFPQNCVFLQKKKKKKKRTTNPKSGELCLFV